MRCEIEHYCPNCGRSFPVNLESRLSLAEAVVEAARAAVANSLEWERFDSGIAIPESDLVFTKRMQEALAAFDALQAKGGKE